MYDEQGQLLNASFMDYLLPTATDVPPIETAHRETPSPFNPIGTEGRRRSRLHSDRRRSSRRRSRMRSAAGIEIREIPLSPQSVH